VNILRVPYSILSPLIVAVCFIGAFSVDSRATDVLMMVLFGLVGYLMGKFGYSPAPLCLAYVLGPMLETSLRQTLIMSNGSIMVFFRRPMSAAFLSCVILILIIPLLRKALWKGYTYFKRVSS